MTAFLQELRLRRILADHHGPVAIAQCPDMRLATDVSAYVDRKRADAALGLQDRAFIRLAQPTLYRHN